MVFYSVINLVYQQSGNLPAGFAELGILGVGRFMVYGREMAVKVSIRSLHFSIVVTQWRDS